MKSFGVISKLDSSGEVELPPILMALCKLEEGDAVEICPEEDKVIIKKHPQTCIFCGSTDSLKEYMKKSFCNNCAEELRNY